MGLKIKKKSHLVIEELSKGHPIKQSMENGLVTSRSKQGSVFNNWCDLPYSQPLPQKNNNRSELSIIFAVTIIRDYLGLSSDQRVDEHMTQYDPQSRIYGL